AVALARQCLSGDPSGSSTRPGEQPAIPESVTPPASSRPFPDQSPLPLRTPGRREYRSGATVWEGSDAGPAARGRPIPRCRPSPRWRLALPGRAPPGQAGWSPAGRRSGQAAGGGGQQRAAAGPQDGVGQRGAALAERAAVPLVDLALATQLDPHAARG